MFFTTSILFSMKSVLSILDISFSIVCQSYKNIRRFVQYERFMANGSFRQFNQDNSCRPYLSVKMMQGADIQYFVV